MNSLALLVEVASDLRKIVELHGHLVDQAFTRAADKDMPGGAAMVMLGPVASPQTFANRVHGLERYNDDIERWELGLPEKDDSHIADNDTDVETVLQTLVFWSETVREHLGQPVRRPTVTTEALFLGQILNQLHANPRFDLFATDVHDARWRLESILKDGERDTEGILCPRCRSKYMIRTEHNRSRPRGCTGHGHFPACPVLPRINGRVQQCNCGDRGGLIHEWICPACTHTLDREGYDRAVFQNYVHNAPYLELKYLNFQVDGVKPGTVKVWASRGHVRTKRNERGDTTYCIADIKRRISG